MNEPRSRQLATGLIVVVAGLALLAINFGWLQIDLWTFLWRFWPLLIIIAGVNILIKNTALQAVISIALLGAALWSVSYAPEPIRERVNGTAGQAVVRERQELREDRGDADRLKLKLDLGAASVVVRSLDNSNQAYRAQFENTGRIEEAIGRRDRELNISLDEQRAGFRGVWGTLGSRRAELDISRELPVEFELDSGASKQDLDFTQVQLERLKLDIGASSGTLTFGARTDLEATIEAGASSLTLRVPKDAGVKIINDSGLTSNNFTDAGLERNGDTYQTSDFDSQSRKLVFRIDAGASSLKLERY